MQRYRVNYKLLIGLCVGLIVVGVGGYFGLKYQLDRNAAQLLRRADSEIEAGELREASAYLFRYCRQRPEDAAAAERMAEIYQDILELPDVELSDYGNAVQILERVVRSHGDELPNVRKDLANLYFLFRRWIDALKHIDVLIQDDPKNPELQLLRSRCLTNARENEKAMKFVSKLIGLDRASGEFSEEKATGPNVVEAYPILANLIYRENDDLELAREVMNRMVEVNPDSATALVMRSRFLLAAKGDDEQDEDELQQQEEQADADLAKALEIAPTNAAVLLANAARKRQLEDYEATRELLEKAQRESPENGNVYRELAQLEIVKGEEGAVERAIVEIEAGLKQTGAGARPILLFDKAEMLASTGNAEALEEAIKDLSDERGVRSEQLDFLRGRLAMLGGEWHTASKLFEKIRPVVSTSSMGGTTNYLLGLCYEKLSQFDLAQEALEVAQDLQPSNKRIGPLLSRIKKRLNPGTTQSADSLAQLVSEELRKPKAEQDWDGVDKKAIEMIAEREMLPAIASLVRAEIALRGDRTEDSKRLIEEALAGLGDNPVAIGQALVLSSNHPDIGPAEALKQYNELIAPKYYDQSRARLIKADLLIAVGDDDLTDQLLALLEGTDEWPKIRRVALLKSLARKFSQLRDVDSQREMLARVVEESPGELAVLLDLFQAALIARDQDTVREIQGKILKVVGSEEDPTWLFTEATRLATEATTNQNDPELLAKANDLVDRALGIRQDWHLLHVTRANIAFAMGKRRAALRAFDRAKELGPMGVLALIRHIGLLSEAGRYADARRALEAITPAIRQRLLGRQYAEVLLNTGSVREALDAAAQVGEAGADNAGVQLWAGRFLRRVSRSTTASEENQQEARAAAEAALEAVVSLTPGSAEGWLELVLFHASNADRDATEDVLRRTQVALPADQSTVVIARGYELIGRFLDAENLYLTIEERLPNDLGMKRQMAAFYLSNRYPREDSQLKATRLINKILTAANDNPEAAEQAPNASSIRWARRAAAELLSRTNDYQNLLKSERLLAGNAVDGRLQIEDQLVMAQLLAPRPEPASQLKAIELLESVRRTRPLDVNTGLSLGRLYYSTGDWDRCRQQMTELIAANRESPILRAAYLRMLLQRDGSVARSDMDQQLKALQKLAPKSQITAELMARRLTKLGQEDQAWKVLAPLISGQNVKNDTARKVAGLLSEFGDLDNAERIYSTLAKNGPSDQLRYAAFLGVKKDYDKAFAMLDELRPELNVSQISSVAVSIVKARRAEAGAEIDAKAQRWLDRGLREDPESIGLLLQQASLYEIQQNYPDAIAAYKRLLALDDLDRRYRALVLNNVAYLIALSSDTPSDMEEAMGYVAEAVDILGPGGDILDTRALVFISLNKPDEAIADLELALTAKPTASKHFHKSRAHLLAGQVNEASEEWDKANELGLRREDLAPAERDVYDKLLKEFSDA